MTYIEGFILAVPTANRAAYIDHAEEFQPMFARFGATRVVETWGDDVPDGKVTDFRKAVQATEDETIVFSWFEYPDRATRDTAVRMMTADPAMQAMSASEMPFDGKRMIYAGFDSIVDEGKPGGGYIDGIIVPVPEGNREAYRAIAAKMAPIFLEHGALRSFEAWGDDLPDGKVTDFRRATQAVDGEAVVYSWIEWPDKAARDAGWGKVMADDRMKPGGDQPFDGQRMFWGGFTVILDK